MTAWIAGCVNLTPKCSLPMFKLDSQPLDYEHDQKSGYTDPSLIAPNPADQRFSTLNVQVGRLRPVLPAGRP